MTRKLKLRVPSIPFDRAKRAIALIGLGAALEYVDPLPFAKSPFAWVLWFGLLLEIIRQFWTYRMEVSYPAVARAESYKRQWRVKRDKVDPNVRYRLRRFVTLIVGFYAYGWVVSLFSDRCDGGFSCGLLSFQLAIESMPEFLKIAVSIALGLMQMAFMFIALTKVGFVKIVQPGTIDTTFDDVFGQDDAKKRVVEQVDLLEDDAAVSKAGGYMPKGVMLTGPPGTGKTMMAKAAANRSTKPLILIPPGAFASTFIGINFLKVWQLGRYIRKYSKRHGGVIVFFDEIDVLGNRGAGVEGGNLEPWFEKPLDECAYVSTPHVDPVIVTGGGGGMNMGTLEAFLSMMDGMEEPRGMVNKVLALAGFKPLPPPTVRVFYLGATNRPSAVDPALKRAGRFGREIRVDYPRYEGRLNTYKGYLSKVQHNLLDNHVEWFARNHYRGTGAEIQDIVNEALLITFREHHNQGVIGRDDMMKAMLWKRFGEPLGTAERDDIAYNTAVHEAGHALLLYATMRHRTNIWFGSIEKRGRTGGMIAHSPLDDDFQQSRSEMIAGIAVSLASRVAEVIVNGEMSNGHGGDGPAATLKAERMVQQGHGGQIAFTTDRDPEKFHEEREAILQEAFDLAYHYVESNQAALLALADLFVEKHTVLGDEIFALFEEYEVG